MRDRLRYEPEDTLLTGHFPHLPRLLALLLHSDEHVLAEFAPHGIVALETGPSLDEGALLQRHRVVQVYLGGANAAFEAPALVLEPARPTYGLTADLPFVFAAMVNLLFSAFLVALLLHPTSRSYQRIYFR